MALSAEPRTYPHRAEARRRRGPPCRAGFPAGPPPPAAWAAPPSARLHLRTAGQNGSAHETELVRHRSAVRTGSAARPHDVAPASARSVPVPICGTAHLPAPGRSEAAPGSAVPLVAAKATSAPGRVPHWSTSSRGVGGAAECAPAPARGGTEWKCLPMRRSLCDTAVYYTARAREQSLTRRRCCAQVGRNSPCRVHGRPGSPVSHSVRRLDLLGQLHEPLL